MAESKSPLDSRAVAECADPSPRKPLMLLRDTERSLRVKTVSTLAPLLPDAIALQVGETSIVADDLLNQLADIDLDNITDEELKPARIQIGLLFIGFGALAMAFLMLFLYLFHSEITPIDSVKQRWYAYSWFVCLGITGLFMVGREAMRP
jgi:hypothetical protein